MNILPFLSIRSTRGIFIRDRLMSLYNFIMNISSHIFKFLTPILYNTIIYKVYTYGRTDAHESGHHESGGCSWKWTKDIDPLVEKPSFRELTKWLESDRSVPLVKFLSITINKLSTVWLSPFSTNENRCGKPCFLHSRIAWRHRDLSQDAWRVHSMKSVLEN